LTHQSFNIKKHVKRQSGIEGCNPICDWLQSRTRYTKQQQQQQQQRGEITPQKKNNALIKTFSACPTPTQKKEK
jgi:hypothetical protein